MRKFGFILILTAGISWDVSAQGTVSILYDNSANTVTYAKEILEKSCKKGGYSIKTGKSNFSINLTLVPDKMDRESFALWRNGNTITIQAGGDRGLIYGCFSLAEDLNRGTKLQSIKPKNESSKLPFRGIKFDLPWDTYRHSFSLDQHQETCRDLNYWISFLDMMAENRFNTLTLWNLHPYVYMIKPNNFPEASPFNDQELKEWKHLFGSIFTMAKARGIDTYVIPFNIFVSPEFAEAHNVAMDNLEHHFFVRGDTSEIIKRYTRECVTQLLNEYPDLTGMGLTLGEGMAGMTPQQREDWMKETIIAGMQQANRKSKLIHRIPFSGTTASLGATSIEMEQVTRKGIEQEAAMSFVEGPVWADLKFNWSHAHSTSKLIKVHGGKLYGTYFNPVPTDYKVTWTARNEDFFCLRWGVPDFVREHVSKNSQPYVGGYLIGSETYIPAKDYFTKPDIAVPWKYAFERQWLFYMIWGRLLYNADTSNDVFEAAFTDRYGKTGKALMEASALAGQVPLKLASYFDFTWDFTLYSEGFMALNRDTKRFEFISAERLINQPPLDSAYVSIAEYVKATSGGKSFGNDRITPLALASTVERDCKKALALVNGMGTSRNAALNQEVADIKTWANLGLYFSEKLRGATDLQTYRTNGGDEHKQNAIRHFERALASWDVVIHITLPLYNDMPLVHFSEQDGKPWKENDHLRFHWEKLRGDVLADIDAAKSAKR